MHPRDECPSITSVRSRISAVMREEIADSTQHLVILAIDGLRFDVAAGTWKDAQIERLRSVFPTTSSTAWLSSVTGLDVSDHGIPGVAYTGPEGDLINVYRFAGELRPWTDRNIFSDAAALAWQPIAVLGDLEHLECSWRSLLVAGATALVGHPFFARPDATPASIHVRLREAIAEAMVMPGVPRKMIWCFIDADLHIHRHGYDRQLSGFLSEIEELALALARTGTTVVAYSDHGLVATRNDPELARLLDSVGSECERPMGGAGRTRWLYPKEGRGEALRLALEDGLPQDVRLADPDLYFRPGSPARERVGSVLLIAEGTSFLAEPGCDYEHGSLTDGELYVPFAVWRG